MSVEKLNQLQTTDADGNAIINCNKPVAVNGSGTVVLISGNGVWLGFTIWDEVADGTFYFTDGDDDAIAGLPNSTNKGGTDAKGAFAVPRLEVTNGLKIVTAAATGLVATGWVFIVNP
jgi:hypothetical protein